MSMKRSVISLVVVCMVCCATAWAQDEAPLIGEVVVEGNDFVAREAILDVVKDVLKVGEAYTETKSAEAQRLIRNMGYFDEVGLSTEQLDEGVRVIITVVEKQRIEEVMFAGNTVISDEELTEAIITEPGHVADERRIASDVGKIEDYYETNGYLARVSEAQVDAFGVLTFVVEEARLEDIVIEGLDSTRPWLVRREMDLEPGEIFNQERVATNLRGLHATRLFESIQTDIRAGEENPLRDVILVITLEEAQTGRAAVAAGYSSLDNFVVMLEAEERNVRGQGEQASVGLELGGRESYSVSFFEPYLDSEGSTVKIELFDTERSRRFIGASSVSLADDEFDERRTGGTLTFTRPVGAKRRVSVGLRSVEVSSSLLQGTTTLSPGVGITPSGAGVRQINDGTGRTESPVPDNPQLEPDVPEPGDLATPVEVAAPLHPGGRVNSISLGLIEDTRDVAMDPTRGTYSQLSYEQAGAFMGGSTDFGKLTLEHTRYYRIGSDDVLAVRGMGGTTLGSPPLFESFSVGGANTLRGYEVDRWRGENLILGNVEYRRAVTDALTAVGFVDAGAAYGGTFDTEVPGFRIKAEDQDLTPHVGFGVGLRVQTPVGPLRLDMGFSEEGEQAHFGFGHTF